MFGYSVGEWALIGGVVVLLLAIPTFIVWYIWRLARKAEEAEEASKLSTR